MSAEVSEEHTEESRPSEPVAEYSDSPPMRQRQQAEAGPAIREAVEQLQRINRDLEELLLEMQKALETLEEAEVQKWADERDIESLRSALRQLNRTRENIPRPPQQQSSRQDNRQRNPQREQRFQASHRQRSPGRDQDARTDRPKPPESHDQPHSEQPPPAEEHGSEPPPHEPESPF
jgi:hypothetical protein